MASRCGRRAPPASAGSATTLVFLLPGNPVSCLCAYDFFAGRAIRLRGGRPADWPHRTRPRRVARKIVSAIGRVDYCRVRIVDGAVEPIALERRIDPLVDDARRRLRDRARAKAKATGPTPKSPCTCTTDRPDRRRRCPTRPTEKRAAPDSGQTQFLNVVTRDEATARFREHLRARAARPRSRCRCIAALDRVLAEDVVADVDVPGFDRSNVDGFAVQAADTFGAMEEAPRRVRAQRRSPRAGHRARRSRGHRRRDADRDRRHAAARRRRGADGRAFGARRSGGHGARSRCGGALTAGENVSYAGTDIARGETVLRAGQRLTSREIGVLAAVGLARGRRLSPAARGHLLDRQRDRRARPAAASRRRLRLQRRDHRRGGRGARRRRPFISASFPTTKRRSTNALARGLECDLVIFSGGTSKGAGDLSYRVVERLAQSRRRRPWRRAQARQADLPRGDRWQAGRDPARISDVGDLHVPRIRRAGDPRLCRPAGRAPRRSVAATLPMRVNSERGRTEYLLVGLVQGPQGLTAYPMGKGSGSVTTFSGADGFITIDQHTEILDAGSDGLRAAARAGARARRPRHHRQPLRRPRSPRRQADATGHRGRNRCTSEAWAGSRRRSAANATSPAFICWTPRPANTTVLCSPTTLVARAGLRPHAGHRAIGAATRASKASAPTRRSPQRCRAPDCVMVNRNAGSGTRIIIDRLLGAARPSGYGVQTKSHNAVAAAVAQGRADWGVAIDTVARQYGLGFIPVAGRALRLHRADGAPRAAGRARVLRAAAR